MSETADKYIHYRELQSMFDAYQKPALLRALDKQGIGYFIDSNGQPFTLRATINSALAIRPTDPAATDSPG